MAVRVIKYPKPAATSVNGQNQLQAMLSTKKGMTKYHITAFLLSFPIPPFPPH